MGSRWWPHGPGGIPDVVTDGETGLLVTHGVVAELLRRVAPCHRRPGAGDKAGSRRA